MVSGRRRFAFLDHHHACSRWNTSNQRYCVVFLYLSSRVREWNQWMCFAEWVRQTQTNWESDRLKEEERAGRVINPLALLPTCPLVGAKASTSTQSRAYGRCYSTLWCKLEIGRAVLCWVTASPPLVWVKIWLYIFAMSHWCDRVTFMIAFF